MQLSTGVDIQHLNGAETYMKFYPELEEFWGLSLLSRLEYSFFFNSMGFLRLVSRAGSRSIDPEMAVSQMAQAAYVQALKAEIVKAGLQPLQSETAHE